ncbi:MAG: amino acid adenylation domain-containing protein, partial [Clostridia bacterium]|nr:amino acid adenylation domain-containing protein [Clostridia bacterium]
IENQQQQGLKSTEFDFCSLAEIQSMTPQGSELIKIVYAFENYASGTAEENDRQEDGNGKTAFDVESSREQTNYGISVSSHTENGRLAFEIMYDPSRYPSAEIDLLLDRLSNICVHMSESADKLVSSISEITDEEKSKILTEFNATETSYPKEKTIVELFEEQVNRTPDKTAVVYGSERLTYAELNLRANAIAYKLREIGLQPEDFVAITADKSLEMVCGIYGILKSGGAYLPIDPTYPQARISFMLEDCSPKAILTFTDKNIVLPDNIISMTIDSIEVKQEFAQNPVHVNKSNDLAYCIYTSGTTGKPKGVAVEHYGVANLREYFMKIQGVNENDRVLQFASIAFDAMVSEMTMGLLTGACMYIISPEVQQDPKLFETYTAENQISIAILPPAYLAQVNLTGFRTIITAGSETNSKLVQSNSHIEIYSNDYGPTETTVCATYWKHKNYEPVPDRIPIGKPMNNKQIYIMNGNNLCGIGVPGELCIAGEGIARGYLNRPELTAEKFVKNPFGEGRMYRSGDLARWLPDGNIEYLGRIDDQVKIRDFRIELGEIESRIREIPNISDCAVVAKNDSSGDKAICAYYVSDSEISVSEIRDKLVEVLPYYMMPAYMMQIESIPVTRNGKLDKNALPSIDAAASREYVAPETEIEKIICNIFEEILNAERVGVYDDFFELGGHSLKATRLVNAVRSKTGFKLVLNDVFKNTTPKMLAEMIEENNSGQQNSIPKAEKKEYYPMSPAQRRTFFIQQMEPDSTVYNMVRVLALRGD